MPYAKTLRTSFDLIIVVLCFTSRPINAQFKDFGHCFLPTYHRGISNSPAIGELYEVSPVECLRHCVQNAGTPEAPCASVVYHRHFSTCQMYSHDGMLGGSRVVFASGHDYYNRTDYEGICRGNLPAPRHRQHGTKILASSENDLQSMSEDYHDYGESPKPVQTLESKPEPVVVRPKPRPIAQRVHHFMLPNQPTTGCPHRQRLAYVHFNDYSLARSKPQRVIEGVGLQSCIEYCSQNLDTVGDPAPCILISFQFANGRCEMHGNKAKEVGILTRVESHSGYYFAEKLCIPARPECGPHPQFRAVTRKRITDGYLAQLSHEMMSDCIANCLAKSACQSVTYRNGYCTLHSVRLSVDDDDASGALSDADDASVVIDVNCRQEAATFYS